MAKNYQISETAVNVIICYEFSLLLNKNTICLPTLEGVYTDSTVNHWSAKQNYQSKREVYNRLPQLLKKTMRFKRHFIYNNCIVSTRLKKLSQ